MTSKLKKVFEVRKEALPPNTQVKLYDGVVIQTPHMDEPVRILAREQYRVSDYYVRIWFYMFFVIML